MNARVPCHEVARIYLDSPSVPDYDSPSERRERLKVPRKVHIGKEKLSALFCAAAPYYCHAQRPRKLYRCHAHAARCAVDKYALARLCSRFMNERPVSRRVRHAYARALAERELLGQPGELGRLAQAQLRVCSGQ